MDRSAEGRHRPLQPRGVRSRRLSTPLAMGLLLAVAVVAPRAATPSDDLLDPRLRDLLHEELSGELAKEQVIAITRHHRIQGSRGYRDAAHYVLDQLRGWGFAEPPEGYAATLQTPPDPAAELEGGRTAAAGLPPAAWIESFPSDGRVVYQTWQSPSGWDIDAAELRLMEPCDDPAGERIIGFPEIAMSVVTYSNPGDVTAELVWVGSGEREQDYAGKDVAGKFVLATGYGGNVHRRAVLERGAAAVVCFLDDERAADHPDMLQYTGMWPRTAELERTTFGFNLTHRQGARLRDMLLAGQQVVLRGWVSGTGLEPYFMDVVVATIPGSERPDEEIVFSAHLDHPKESANDNASGSAAILDIARTLRQLVDSGRLPPPRRTLRFLWVPEWNGTMAYIDSHPELVGPALGGKVLANLNLDMVGEDLELLHSRLILTRTPDSLPSCLNDVVQNMAEMVDGMDIRTPRGGRSSFNWRMTPYSGGSDHMMFIDRKIPAVMFTHAPDYTHHTSEDTPDKVDPVELERCELIAAGAGLYLSDVDAGDRAGFYGLMDLITANTMAEFGRSLMRAQRPIAAATDSVGWETSHQSVLVLEMAQMRSKAVLRSLESFAPTWIKGGLWGTFQTRVVAVAQGQSGMMPKSDFGGAMLSPPVPEGAKRVPVRLTRGPLAFDLPESRLDAERAAWYRTPEGSLSGDVRFEIANFIDGQRSVMEIRDAVSAEFGAHDVATVLHYIEDLVAIGVAEWKS